MSTRNGKLGRLSKGLRGMVCGRLENGETNKSVAAWLNSLPEVQEMLKESFEGRPINEQNMSEWKAGGYVEWQRLQEVRGLARQLAEDGETLESDSDFECFSDRLGLKLAVELAHLMKEMLAEEKDPEKKWQRLKELNRELSQIRRDDHRAAKLKMERKQREDELVAKMDAESQEMEEKHKRKMKDLILGPMKTRQMGELLKLEFGEQGPAVAELLRVVDSDLSLHRRWTELEKGIERLNAQNRAGNQAPSQAKNPENPGQSN